MLKNYWKHNLGNLRINLYNYNMKNKLVGLNKNDIRKIVESKLKKLITKSKYFKIDEYFAPKIKEPQQ